MILGRCSLLVLTLACSTARIGHAQESVEPSQAEASNTAPAEPAPSAAEAPAPTAVTAPTEAAAAAALEEDAPAYSPEAARQQRMRELERKLAEAQREREDSSVLLPAALTITGIAAVVTGLVAAAAPSLTCDDSCSQPFWPSWLAIGGATVGTAGAIWLHRALQDQQELDAAVHGVERELEYEHLHAAPRAQLKLRLSF